jgi:hypothetical protein
VPGGARAHRLGRLALEEELDDFLGLGADDPVKEHVVRIRVHAVFPDAGGGVNLKISG